MNQPDLFAAPPSDSLKLRSYLNIWRDTWRTRAQICRELD